MGKMKDLQIELEELLGKEEAKELARVPLPGNPPRHDRFQERTKGIIALLLRRIQHLEEQLRAAIEERDRILGYHNGLSEWTERELLVELLWRLEQGKDMPWGLSDDFLERVYRITGQELLHRDLITAPQTELGYRTRKERKAESVRKEVKDGRSDREDQPA